MRLLLGLIAMAMFGCASQMTQDQREALYALGVGMQSFGDSMQRNAYYREQQPVMLPEVSRMPDYMAPPIQVQVQRSTMIPPTVMPTIPTHY